MKKTQIATWLQNKYVLAALLMVLVAGTAAAGVVALRSDKDGEVEETEPGYAFQTQEDLDQHQVLEKQPEELPDPDVLVQRPDNEENIGEEHRADQGKRDDESVQDRPVQSDRVDAATDVQDGLDASLSEIAEGQNVAETLVSAEDAVVYEPEQEAEEVIAPGAPLEFQAGSTMGWPVFGNILLDYSMDTTIYFPTLKQYKCNPGILIQAEVGQPVEATVRGQVTAIGSNEELGDFIMMDLGGDYTLLYGQLTELNVAVGQTIEPGYVLGTVAQPTKYYVVEGPNLYLELRYQQKPVDPLDYIR